MSVRSEYYLTPSASFGSPHTHAISTPSNMTRTPSLSPPPISPPRRGMDTTSPHRNYHQLDTSHSIARTHSPPSVFAFLDWFALGNHLFTVGSVGYLAISIFRVSYADPLPSISNATFFGLGILGLFSSVFYWLDILLFPRLWTRRKYYHPLNREKARIEAEEEIEDEEEEYIMERSLSEMEIYFRQQYQDRSQPQTQSLPPNPSHRSEFQPKVGPALPYLNHQRTRSDRLSTHLIAPPLPSAIPFASSPSLSSPTFRRSHTFHAADSSIDHSLDDNTSIDHVYGDDVEVVDDYDFMRSKRRLRLCPIRTETYSEVLNLLGAILNSISTTLPYALVTFRPDRGINYDSIPLPIATMDFLSMSAWLISSILVFYIWRRDKIATARDEWESTEEKRTGVSREQRRRMEAQEMKMKLLSLSLSLPLSSSSPPGSSTQPSNLPLPDSSSRQARFDPSTVEFTLVDFSTAHWWAVTLNLIASIIYWSGCVYSLATTLKATEEGRDHISSQEIRSWMWPQYVLYLSGDIVYLLAAIGFELVYWIETNKETTESEAAHSHGGMKGVTSANSAASSPPVYAMTHPSSQAHSIQSIQSSHPYPPHHARRMSGMVGLHLTTTSSADADGFRLGEGKLTQYLMTNRQNISKQSQSHTASDMFTSSSSPPSTVSISRSRGEEYDYGDGDVDCEDEL